MYAEHFGFSKLPFSLTPDAQVFFSNSLCREAFAKLQHGVRARKGVVLITGDAGTGKTTLLRKFIHSSAPTVRSICVSDARIDFTDLLRLLLEDLNLAHGYDDKRTMIRALNRDLMERSRQGRMVALVIDDAQISSDETLDGLRLLSGISSDSEKPLQIILAGRPELGVRLDHPRLRQLKQRIAIHCRLTPLKEEDVRAYIEFQLNAVGFRGTIPFAASSLEAIAFYSKGIPRLVNMICDKALLAACAGSKTEVSAPIVDEVARDLQLGPPRAQASHPVIHKTPDNRVAASLPRARQPELANVFVGVPRERGAELQRKRRSTVLAAGIVLGAVFIGGIAVSSSQQSKAYLSDLSARLEVFSRDGRDYFSHWTVKVKDAFERTPVWTREAVRSPGESSSRVKGAASPAKLPLASVRDVNQSMRSEPLPSVPWQPADDSPPLSQALQQPARDDKAADPQSEKNNGASNRSGTIPVTPMPEQTDSGQLAPWQPGSVTAEASNDRQNAYMGNFQVVGKTFLRGTPASDAEIVTTLKPGSVIRVEQKSGKYLVVRSTDDPTVHGYVHQEDAFLNPIQ